MTDLASDARRFAVSVVHRLREAGHEALWAGGCVRDLLLGVAAKDYDVATSARPEAVRRLFRRTIPVGISFGVVRVLGTGGAEVEVATFRTDASYSDGRHPDAVTFSTPREDALRRDFTINGMFYDPLDERIHDYVGGREDLQRRVLRAIGDPRQRLAEDKLRLLRAVRFAARFGLDIDPATCDAIRATADQLGVVSAERVLMELRLILAPPTRGTALELVRSLNLVDPVFPEISTTLGKEPNWRRTVRILGHWRSDVSLPLALCGLLATRPGATASVDAERILRRLKCSNEDRDRAVWLATRRDDLAQAPRKPLALLKRLFAHPGFDELLRYRDALDADSPDGSPDDAEYTRRLRDGMTAAEFDPPPLLTGIDLIAAGLRPGPRFKELLERVRDEQLDEELTSKDEALVRVRAWLAGERQ